MTDETKRPEEDLAVESREERQEGADISAEESPAEGAEGGSPDSGQSSVAEVVSSSEAEVTSPGAVGESTADEGDSTQEDSIETGEGEVEAAPRGPIELIEEVDESEEEPQMDWYILKVQVNRENSICDALKRRVKIEGLERYFGEILVPTEDVREFNKSGKQRIVKRKLYPGYIVVYMAINDDTWFLVRETPGIGDFTGAAGKPSPLTSAEIEKILQTSKVGEEDDQESSDIKTAIKFRAGDRVRVKEGYFQNFEGDVEAIDESNGRVTVMINIFGRPTPVELDHWQVEDV